MNIAAAYVADSPPANVDNWHDTRFAGSEITPTDFAAGNFAAADQKHDTSCDLSY